MFGFCQNVQIVHQHHHHFYEIMVSSSPKKISQHSNTLNHSLNAGKQFYPLESSVPLRQTHTPRLYQTKREYLNKHKRGIELICKESQSFNQSHPNCNFHSYKQPFIQQQVQTPSLLESLHQRSFIQNHRNLIYAQRPYSFVISHPKDHHLNEKIKPGNTFVSVERTPSRQKMQLSTPSSLTPNSNKSSSTTKYSYINCHRLKQSKIGMQISITSNKTKKLQKQDHQNRKKQHRSNIQIEKDLVMTKKQQFLGAFKTQKMFEDARSICSHQSLDNQCLQMEESIIISHSLDYFYHITPERDLPTSKVYLARDSCIHWLISIRLFEFKNELDSLGETQLYNHLSLHPKLPFLQLYKILVEGAGLHKNILFVLQPYENILDSYLSQKKGYFRAVPASFDCLLAQLQEELKIALEDLRNWGVSLIQYLTLQDIVLINSSFKFISLNKFSVCSNNQNLNDNYTPNKILDRLKQEAANLVRCS